MDDFLSKLTTQWRVFRAMMSLPDFWRNVVDLLASSLLINVLSLALPLVILQLYDRILPFQGVGSLAWLMLGAAIAVILEAVIRQIRSLIGAWWGARVEHIVSKSAIHRILHSQSDEYLKTNPGVHLDRVNSVDDFTSVFSGNMFQTLLDLPFAYLYIWCIWLIGGMMVWIPLSVIGIYLVFVFFCNRMFIKAREEQIRKHEERFGFYIETFNGIHAVKSVAMEESVLRRAEAIHGDFTVAEDRAKFWSNMPSVAGKALSQVALFAIILYGAFLLINDSLTLGILTASTMLVRRSMVPFIMLSASWLQLSKAKLALSKLGEIGKLPSERNHDKPFLPKDVDGAVVFEDVSYIDADGGACLLKNASFDIGPRKFACVSGDNAEGTTALLSLIRGEVVPNSGLIYIDHYDLSSWSMANPEGVVAYVPNKGMLFEGTVMDNITMFEPGKELDAMNVAALLDLNKDVAKLPAGFQTKVNSMSNRIFPTSLIQRISLARALMRYPRILLLDRVNQAVDKDTEIVFQKLLSFLRGRTTLVLATNDPKYIKRADKAFHLHNDGALEPIARGSGGV